MGENGAGKSTLMKILAGIYKQDQGEMFRSLDGKITGLESLSVGLNTTVEHEFADYQFGMRMLFENREKLAAYQLHPDHLEAVQLVREIVDAVAVVDFECAN
jgi:ABC-type polysaccharide/polyol phosphate transport system ATPase subunit